MHSRTVTWMPLLLAGGFAALTYWLAQVGRLGLPLADLRPAHVPDSIVEDFKAHAFDAEGRLRHVLVGRQLVHYMDDDSARLEAPQFAQYAPGQPALTVRARYAEIAPGGSEVHFHDEVRLVREAAPGREAIVLDTEYLHAIPDARRLYTDRGVRVRQGRASIEARVMQVEGRQQAVSFSGQVRSRYEAP